MSRQPIDSGDGASHPSLVWAALQVEGALFVLALGLGWLGLRDPEQSLVRFSWEGTLRPALLWGLAGAVPVIAVSLWGSHSKARFWQPVQSAIHETLLPLVRQCDWAGLAIVALLAGLGEELLFRWSLQGGLERLLPAGSGTWIALLIASAVFGCCHFVNREYFLVATVIGVWLGLLMIWSGTWLAPALAHTLVDLVALAVLAVRGEDQIVKGPGQAE